MNRVNSETGCYYYDSAVTAEVVRAKTAERGLSVLIDNEKERASQAENEIRESVAAESRRAESKEAEILETFNTTVSEVTGSLEAIKQIESTLVHRSGDETISDVKTFSSSPKVPTPGSSSNDTSVATTAFVKGRIDEVDRVIETWVASDNMSWYRKYSSGWIEQGGVVDSVTTGSYTTVVKLPKPMRNKYYSLSMTRANYTDDDTGDFDGWTNQFTVASITTAGFSVHNYSQKFCRYVNWIVCGYAQ